VNDLCSRHTIPGMTAPWFSTARWTGPAFDLYTTFVGALRATVRIALQAAEALLVYLLPPYSPDLNPIEMVFAKLKPALRKATATSIHALISAIAQAPATFKPQECTNFLTAGRL
jgi:DDE superfamily endonuclease